MTGELPIVRVRELHVIVRKLDVTPRTICVASYRVLIRLRPRCRLVPCSWTSQFAAANTGTDKNNSPASRSLSIGTYRQSVGYRLDRQGSRSRRGSTLVVRTYNAKGSTPIISNIPHENFIAREQTPATKRWPGAAAL